MAEIRRVLVVKLSALGDLFHAMPVIHLLKTHYGCEVDWVTQPEYAELAACHRDVDRVIAFPRKGGLSAWRRFAKELREQHYDLVLDLQGLFKSGVVLGLSRATRKIAPSSPREGAAWFAREVPRSAADSPHALDRLLDTLRHLELPTGPLAWPLDFPPADPLPGRRPRLAVAPKSRWPAKDWPLERFADALRRLRAASDVDVVVIGGPDDHDAGETLVQALNRERVWNLCGKTPLIHLGSQLREVDCLLCNDSGPMHFAAAVGTPLVALFGPTDPEKTGPWGGGHTVLRPPPGPEGYPEPRVYKDSENQFIHALTVDEVVKAVLGQLTVRAPNGKNHVQ